jgi:integrase
MSYIFARGTRLWLGYWDLAKKLHQKRTGFVVGQEAQARAALDQIEESIKAGGDPDAIVIGPATVRQYSERWSKVRMAQGLGVAFDDRARIRKHALPSIGHIEMTVVRPRHIRDLVRSLAAAGKLAPRTIRHVYGALHVMFRDAVVDEVITANPCVLKRGDLPKKKDKDPRWRPSAVFTRSEVEQLLIDERIPWDRGVLYALLALAGVRFGEASALRWSSYNTTLEPLGQLLVASSWSTRRHIEKDTKAERPRLVPVHSALAWILAEWKRSGWPEMMGREPTERDLIIPSRRGKNRGCRLSLVRFHEDLDRLGLRHRRQHDLRRTFISLARADGARADVLEEVTHAKRGDIMNLYTELPWPLLCEAVSCLRTRIPGAPSPNDRHLAAAVRATHAEEQPQSANHIAQRPLAN